MRSEGRLDREASTRVGWSRLLPALLTGGILAGTLPTDAQPEPAFVDVALDVGLDFVIKIGPPFKDTAPLEVMQREMGNGAAVGDYDNDGDLDIYLVGQTGFPNRLYRNDLETGSRSFTDVTPPELGELGLSRMAHFVDLDGDGWLDLVVINDDDGTDATPPSRIFRNNGDSSFSDVTAGSGFRPIGFLRAGCALADFDRDGLIDLYVTVWAGRGLEGQFSFPGSNRLYRNLGNFRFRDVTEQANLGGLDRNSFAAIFADFDGDLFPDLFVAVDNTSDEFYWNNRGVFERATEEVGLTHIGNDMGIAAADFDDDGDLDLYVTNITDASTGGVRFGTEQFNALHVNRLSDEGVTRFDNLAGERGVRDTYWGWGVEFVDVDNDGDLDIVAVNGMDEHVLGIAGPGSLVYQTPAVLFINDGDGTFSRLSGAGLDDARDSRALIAFDYDRDGDRDLLITNMNQPVQLMENITSNPGNWLDVDLRPSSQAIGAKVLATFGGMTKRRDILIGGSYLAGHPTEVHFGLGDASSVDTLRIEWPDGVVETRTNVAAGQLLRITKDSGRIKALPVSPLLHPHGLPERTP